MLRDQDDPPILSVDALEYARLLEEFTNYVVENEQRLLEIYTDVKMLNHERLQKLSQEALKQASDWRAKLGNVRPSPDAFRVVDKKLRAHGEKK